MKDLTKGEVIGLIVAIAKKIAGQQATGIQSISWDGQTNSLIFTMSDGSTVSTEISLDATDVPYSNTTSGLTATNIQAAIDELNLIKGVGQTYAGSTNGEIFNDYANNVASGRYSHAGGFFTIAGYATQTVIGTYNDNKSTNLFEVGNGTSNSARSNAFEVSTDGKAYANGIQLAALNDLPQMIDLTGGTA